MIVINPDNKVVILSGFGGFSIPPKSTVNLDKYFTVQQIADSLDHGDLKEAFDPKNNWLTSPGDEDPSTKEIKPTLPLLTFSNSKDLDFIWSGLVYDMCGYGCVSRNIAYRLALDKYNFSVVNPVFIDDHSKFLDPQQLSVMKQLVSRSGDSNVIIFNRSLVSCGTLSHSNKYQVVFHMTETHGLANYVQSIAKRAQEHWVPSNMDVENFKSIGCQRVFKVTLGTNTEVFNSSVLPNEVIKKQCKGFVFLACGENQYRKGYDVLMEAYCKAFTKNDDVTLIILCHDFNLNSYSHDVSRDPHVLVFNKRFLESEIAPVFACADIFVLPSRGEGWCLPANDLGAMGKTCIMPRYGGYLEFLNDENSYLIDVKRVGLDERMNRMDPLYSEIFFPIYGEVWRNKLVGLMKHVYENRDEAKAKGAILQRDVLEKFTWDNTVDQIKFRLSELPVSNIQVPIKRPRTVSKRVLDPSKPEIALFLRGGIGDIVKWSAIYKGLRRKLPEANFKLFTRVDYDLLSDLDYTSVTKVSESFMRNLNGDYDLIISLCHLPYLNFLKKNKALEKLEATWEESLKKFSFDRRYLLSEEWTGKHLIELNTPKVELFSKILGLDVTSEDMIVSQREYDIKEKDYIVISVGADAMAGGCNQTKVWPREYWENLVQRLSIPVVQLGATSDFIVRGTINLLGKTTLRETAYILDKSRLLISIDGGMIHIAKALKKKAVVLWGPTVHTVFGYTDQINLVAENHNCIFQDTGWPIKCPKGQRQCMESITPDFVYDELVKRSLI